MLTLELNKKKNLPIYMQIYDHIKDAILAHTLQAGEKLPSKRALAAQLGVSTITIEGAYGQLMSEGYIYAKPKSGYFISPIENTRPGRKNILSLFTAKEKSIDSANPALPNDISMSPTPQQITSTALKSQNDELEQMPRYLDLSANNTLPDNFPFSIWSKLLRQTLSTEQENLLHRSPTAGIYRLRQAIAQHLLHFRNMQISPEQIIIGAGTEYLYELIIKLIGRDKTYCVEDPGYQKLQRIYTDNGAYCVSLPIDAQGMSVASLGNIRCDVAHISPSHHFPTGIITPVSRRYELLGWASAGQRYIIEDDYDTEFRLVGKPIPALFSMDTSDKVIYMNTFSKSLTSTIRISYMVLPPTLLEEFNRRLSYLSCTVSTFEQYTLAAFIEGGYFERHINRMRNTYKKLRQQLLRALMSHPEHAKVQILQQASGLYFLLKINTALTDNELEARLRQNGLQLQSVRRFYQNQEAAPPHTFVINYSAMGVRDIPFVVKALFASII